MKDPFEIIVTTSYGININLSNQNPKWEKSYSSFTTTEDAAFFADTLERVIKTATYTDRNKCAHCGKYLSKADDLYRMENGEYMHTKCFYHAYEDWHERIESREYVDALTKGGAAKFDFTNLNSVRAIASLSPLRRYPKKQFTLLCGRMKVVTKIISALPMPSVYGWWMKFAVR